MPFLYGVGFLAGAVECGPNVSWLWRAGLRVTARPTTSHQAAANRYWPRELTLGSRCLSSGCASHHGVGVPAS